MSRATLTIQAVKNQIVEVGRLFMDKAIGESVTVATLNATALVMKHDVSINKVGLSFFVSWLHS